MKKAGKIVLYILFSIFFLIVVLIFVASISEEKIAQIAVEQVSKSTDIPIQADEIKFSLIHNFPYATISCKNLLVSSPQLSESYKKDTLVHVGQLYVSVQIRPLLKSIFNIRKVEVSDAEFFYKVDTAGVSNFDFLMDTTQQNVIDTSANVIFLDIKDMELENIMCSYRDEQLKASATVFVEQLDLSGGMKNDQYNGEADGKAIISNAAFDTTKIYLMKQAVLDFKMDYDNGLLKVEKFNVAVDEDAHFALNGKVNAGDRLSAEMIVNAENLNLKELSKYIPENYFTEYGIKEISGMLNAEAHVSGLVNDSVIPFVDVTFQLSDGNLQYQEYLALTQLSLSGKATNGEQKSNETTSLDISSLSFHTAASKFELSGKIQNPDKIEYQLKSVIDLDLQEIMPFVPDSLVKSLNGKMLAEISTSGTLPDSISEEFIYKALAKTQATFQLSNVNANLDDTLKVNGLNLRMNYWPDKIELSNFSAEIPTYNLEIKDLNTSINGKLTTPDSLHLKIGGFNASIPTYNLDVKKLVAELNGNITKPESLDIKVDSLIAESGTSKIDLTGKIKNPMAPDYSVKGRINLNLDEIKNFVPDTLVNSMSGNIGASFQSSAKINPDSITEQMYDWAFGKSSFDLNLDNVTVNMPDSTMSIANLSGQLNYKSDSLYIQQLQANYLGLQFGINSVSVANLYSAALQNQAKELRVHGNFSIDDLDYAIVEKLMQEDSTATPDSDAEPMKFTYKITGNFKANSLKYEDALFKNVNSKFLVKENYYVLDSLKLSAFDGSAVSSIKVEMLPNDEMNLFFKANINKMDVTKVMKSFREYIEYEDIKAENVQGILSTKMDGKIVLKNYEPVYESLMLNGDLTIENGALINVKPVMEIEKIPGVGLKNMDKLYFSTLNSSVFLFNNELYIPRTEIRSTSFDAMFLGMYSFGEDYEYHIRMFLGEVLSSKNKANLKKQAQDGGFTEEDDKDVTKGRTSIYLISKSENGKEKAGFDNKHDRANMVAKVKLQKQMVDMRFNPALVKYNTKE